MKTARLLLACLSLAALTACGSESITAPAAPVDGGAAREVFRSPGTLGVDTTTTSTILGCVGTLTTRISESGETIIECILDGRGPMLGSGN